ETTGEAEAVYRTFHESLRFPWPKAPVRVVLKKRGADDAFHELWSTEVDPAARSVNPADVPARGTVWTLFEHGPPAEKVDLVILGEGY
ncbi:MAG: peptidase M64, partial [Gemmatimonadetes bacterium]|nr:peptidase M64 [Gemmatimonadota bacterium]NIS00111.1 peptidase M64 [Gemmatimonadota bacterium]NIT67736.1 peptidase M64 [Gemmatimonadota bacterium]NIU52139.1 peptidase M64 [Gemmatimonadota bacterium]NIV22462.1 peptidase M64 [Gemmatimonadota bacterium]